MEHKWLDLLPDEAMALGLMDPTEAALLMQYMVENEFLGIDFYSVPPELQEAYESYMAVHRRIGEGPEFVHN